MADTIAPLPRQRRWLKIPGLAAVVAAVLVVALYFILTSAAFLKGVILPRVSSALHATVTVEDASLSPFSSVSLKGLKVVTKDGTPLLQADEVRTGYSLMGMLGGSIKVDEVRIINAAVEINVAPDGKSNLDPLLTSNSSTPPPAKTATKPPQLDIKNIGLQNATLRYIQLRKDGSRIVSEIANVNFTLDQLRNGQASKLTLAADLRNEAGQTTGAATNDLVQAKLDATLNVSLAGDLMPKEVGVKAGVAIGKAQGMYADLAGLTAALNGDLTPTELKELALNFSQGDNALGTIHARGPLVLEKREGKVKLEISAIDRKVLNFAGAKSGLDFGNTRIDSANEISLGQNGRVISATGRLTAQQFTVTQNKTTTIPLDLTVNYDVSVDKDAQSALLQALTLAGTQQARPVLRAALTQPMGISWSTNASTNAVGDAALDLTVSDLNLADWRAFTGDLAPSGKANVNLKLLSQLGGQKLAAKLNARLDDFAATAGTNKIQNAAIEVLAAVQLGNLKKVTVDDFKLGLALKGQPTLLASLSKGTYDLATGDAELQAALDVTLARALALAPPVPGLELKNGTMKFTGRVTQSVKADKKSTNTVQTVTGDLALADLTGRFQDFKFDRLGVTVNTDVFKSNSLVQLNALRGKLAQAANAGGAFDISGGVNLATTNAQFAVKLADVNQNFLAPLVAPSLNGGQLTSISINSSLAAAYDPKGASSVKGDLQVANFLVNDPQKKLPAVPLSIALTLDTTLAKDALEVRELKGKLAQGDNAAGAFDVAGNFNLATTNAQLAVKLADVNQNILAPLAASSLNGGQLTSISINSSLAASYNPKGASSVKGDLQVANFLINDPQKQLPTVPFSIALNLDAALTKDALEVRALKGKLAQGDNAAGAFDVTGSFNLAKNTGQTAFKLDGVNEHLLGPALASALGNKKLVSGAVSATATARYDLAADSSVKAELQLANLLVNDPEKKLPETPLSARVALDGSMKKQVLDLRELLLALSPTTRAKNELRLSGKVDLSDTNATKLNLKLASEALDVTPFYDLFDNPKAKADEKKPAEPTKSTDNANTEPPAMKLPLRDSTVDVSIGKLFLREVAINNWLTTVKVDSGKVSVQPLQFTLNGAPVNAAVNLNLGLPGYQYDLAFGAQGIPVEPLANSFSPTYRGQAKGQVIADVKVKGAGITGESLQRNLDGRVNLSLTNANIELVGPKVKSVLTPIALLLGINEVIKTPLDFVNASIQLGGGKINVQGVDVHSPAFLANVSGVIPIEKVLTNSPLDLPVKMSLTRSVAKKFAFVGNQGDPYVTLPHFASVSGTLGNPGAKTDKVVITGLLATSVAGNVGGKVGGILGGVGSILTGGKTAPAEQPASTNAAPASPQPNKANPLDNLLNPFLKKKK